MKMRLFFLITVVCVYVGLVSKVMALPQNDLLITQWDGKIMRLRPDGNAVLFAADSGLGPQLHGLACDTNDYLYVCDESNNRIVIFSPEEVRFRLVNAGVMADSPRTWLSVAAPTFLVIDGENNLYLSHDGYLTKYNLPSTNAVQTFPASTVSGLVLDNLGNLYAAMGSNPPRIVKFSNGNLQDSTTLISYPSNDHQIEGLGYQALNNAIVAVVRITKNNPDSAVIWFVRIEDGFSMFDFSTLPLREAEQIVVSLNSFVYVTAVSANQLVEYRINFPGTIRIDSVHFAVPDGVMELPRGDLNGDRLLTPSDVVALLNCVYLEIEGCRQGLADINCDGNLSPADVVNLMRTTYLGTMIGCG